MSDTNNNDERYWEYDGYSLLPLAKGTPEELAEKKAKLMAEFEEYCRSILHSSEKKQSD